MTLLNKKFLNLLIMLIISLVLVTVIILFVIGQFSKTPYPDGRTPIVEDTTIGSGSYWSYPINYSSMNIVIIEKNNKYNILQPVVLDDENLSLLQRGMPYQYAPETSSIVFNQSFNCYTGNIRALGSNLVIINNDKNNYSIVSVTIMH